MEYGEEVVVRHFKLYFERLTIMHDFNENSNYYIAIAFCLKIN